MQGHLGNLCHQRPWQLHRYGALTTTISNHSVANYNFLWRSRIAQNKMSISDWNGLPNIVPIKLDIDPTIILINGNDHSNPSSSIRHWATNRLMTTSLRSLWNQGWDFLKVYIYNMYYIYNIYNFTLALNTTEQYSEVWLKLIVVVTLCLTPHQWPIQCTNICPGDPSVAETLGLVSDETPEPRLEAVLLDVVAVADAMATRTANLDRWETVW